MRRLSMRRLSLFALAVAASAFAFASADAHSPRHRHHARAGEHEIIVKKRSFVDPGNVVPVASEDRYMHEGTIYVQTPGGTYRNDNFGAGLIPGPFDLPGYTPGGGYR